MDMGKLLGQQLGTPRTPALDDILDDLNRKHLGYYICPMGKESRALAVALAAARKAGAVALKGFRSGSALPRGGQDLRSAPSRAGETSPRQARNHAGGPLSGCRLPQASAILGRSATSPLRGGFKVSYKSDSSPVTDLDLASEEIIRKTLSSAFPGDGFIGEEYGEIKGKTGASWVIDPIDGTKNFVRGIPFWGSLIARVVNDRLDLGVMHMPATGETIWAVRGGGAFHNGRRIRVSRINRLARSFITYGGLDYFVRNGDAPRLERLATAGYISRSFGDCGAYTYVARGMTEVMLERGLKPWDAAAPKMIIEEAGGKFTDWSGRDNWRSPEALATNGLVHSAVLKIIRG